jgi:hypothetical protein
MRLAVLRSHESKLAPGGLIAKFAVDGELSGTRKQDRVGSDPRTAAAHAKLRRAPGLAVERQSELTEG